MSMPTRWSASLLYKSVPQASAHLSMRHSLQAWIEGHYACDRGILPDVNPYRGDVTMANAWMDGWSCRDRMSLH